MYGLQVLLTQESFSTGIWAPAQRPPLPRCASPTGDARRILVTGHSGSRHLGDRAWKSGYCWESSSSWPCTAFPFTTGWSTCGTASRTVSLRSTSSSLEAVILARNAAVDGLKKAAADPTDPAAIKELAGAEATLGGVLGRLFALAESYPDLKANQNMMQFQEELTSTENRVAFARQAFNDAVMTYNTARENFPNNIVANMFTFKAAEFLEIESEEKRAAPAVSF
jgi:hypothetical protein